MILAATERMFERAGVRDGARVLDLGAGTGDTALMIAARVGPKGSVVATDVAPAMVEAAEASVREAGVANVTVRVMDAMKNDLDAESFDAVVSRNALMFVPDFGAALAGARRVLRPGARLAFIVWAPLAENPFNAIPIDATRARGKLPTPDCEVVRAFSLSDAAALERALAGAGFVDVAVERVAASRVFPSREDAVKQLREIPLYRELMSELDEKARASTFDAIDAAYRAYDTPAGSCVFPMVSLVASGARA